MNSRRASPSGDASVPMAIDAPHPPTLINGAGEQGEGGDDDADADADAEDDVEDVEEVTKKAQEDVDDVLLEAVDAAEASKSQNLGGSFPTSQGATVGGGKK